jgi:protoheme IX farnesyltransferase
LNARRDGFFELNTTLSFWKTWSSEMNVSSIDGEPGERRPGFALLAHSAHPLDGHWSVSDLVTLTKPRVMMLAVFTALVGLSIAPSRLDPPTTLAAVLAIAAGLEPATELMNLQMQR